MYKFKTKGTRFTYISTYTAPHGEYLVHIKTITIPVEDPEKAYTIACKEIGRFIPEKVEPVMLQYEKDYANGIYFFDKIVKSSDESL